MQPKTEICFLFATYLIEIEQQTLQTKIERLNQRLNVEAKILEGTYWSSSPKLSNSLWTIKAETGYRNGSSGTDTANLRCASLVTAASAGTAAPQIGDVMYEDKTYGSAADYNGNKTPVGIIASVSDDKKDVVIINLKDLTFNSDYEAKNFDPDNPYGNSKQQTQWLAGTWPIDTDDFNEFHQIGGSKFILFAQASDNCPCQFYIDDIAGTSCTGIYQCKDSYGSCVTCYAPCKDYDNYSYDEDNVNCSDASDDRFFSIKIGSGKGATASSARCCY